MEEQIEESTCDPIFFGSFLFKYSSFPALGLVQMNLKKVTELGS